MWPGRTLVVTDQEATALIAMGIVLTVDGAATNAIAYGTKIFNGGTP